MIYSERVEAAGKRFFSQPFAHDCSKSIERGLGRLARVPGEGKQIVAGRRVPLWWGDVEELVNRDQADLEYYSEYSSQCLML